MQMCSFPGPVNKFTGTAFIVYGDTSLKMYPTAMEEGSASLLAAERTWDGNVSLITRIERENIF